jgi:hypothetical protein
MRILLVDGTWD